MDAASATGDDMPGGSLALRVEINGLEAPLADIFPDGLDRYL